MEVDDELEAVVRRPSYSVSKIGKLALNVWFATRDVPSPVADGQADMIETR